VNSFPFVHDNDIQRTCSWIFLSFQRAAKKMEHQEQTCKDERDKKVEILFAEKNTIKMSEAACDYLHDGDWKSAIILFQGITQQGDTSSYILTWYGSALLNSDEASERKKGA
jgi:hypothetical protein